MLVDGSDVVKFCKVLRAVSLVRPSPSLKSLCTRCASGSHNDTQFMFLAFCIHAIPQTCQDASSQTEDRAGATRSKVAMLGSFCCSAVARASQDVANSESLRIVACRKALSVSPNNGSVAIRGMSLWLLRGARFAGPSRHGLKYLQRLLILVLLIVVWLGPGLT